MGYIWNVRVIVLFRLIIRYEYGFYSLDLASAELAAIEL